MVHLAKTAIKNLTRRIGFTSQARYIVFESDDWGAIRVPSAQSLEDYCAEYTEVELDHYQALDGLDSYEDAKRLEDCLAQFSDKFGNHPVFTLNFATHNPTFSKGSSGAMELESLRETYMRYFPGKKSTIEMVAESARESHCLHPQLHGREHLNITSWSRGMKNEPRLAKAFELKMIGLDEGVYHAIDALSASNSLVDKEQYLSEAVEEFKNTFGFLPESFIAPCYVISSNEERILADLGIKTLQSGWSRNVDKKGGGYRRIPNIMGARNRYGQVRLIRNCQFEPSKWVHKELPLDECVDLTLRDIECAFSFGQPAIVCTHRVNYTSLIEKTNALKSVEALDELLKRITAKWPDVIFVSSDEMGKIIAG